MHEQSPTKICFKCDTVKPLGEFYKHPRMADGHLNKCKECTKRDVRRHRFENDSTREYDRRRFQENKERRMKSYLDAKNRNKKHPEKYVARYTLKNAVRDGRIEKPSSCSSCGKTECRIEGHHEDYSKPLDVIWMCSRCHRRHEFSKPF